MIRIDAGVTGTFMVPLDAVPDGLVIASFTGPGGTVTVDVEVIGASVVISVDGAESKAWPAQSGIVRIATPDANLATVDVEIHRTTLDRKALMAAAIAVFTANQTYIALPTPTTAQAVAQVRALTTHMNGVIRLLAEHLDLT